VSPTDVRGDRILSEQSENTLDSDSKLSLSFQSKLVRSPPNTSSNSSSITRQTEKPNTAEEEQDRKSEESNVTPFPISSSEKSAAKIKPNNAEQDMFSEHFDVSFDF
jgi:hypothetical protein